MKWQDIEGWLGEDDAKFVKKICANIRNGLVVELGFFAGRCTAVMAPICKVNDNEYYAIDNCKGRDPKDPATKAQQSRDMRQVFESNMKTLGLQDNIFVLQRDSAGSAAIFGNESVDFCFVDASHMEEDVKRDIEAWWPKIKQGGVLGGHDYLWGSVYGVVNDFTRDHGLNLVHKGNCWKIKK